MTLVTRDCAIQCCLLSAPHHSAPQPVKSVEGELERTTESEEARESDSDFADSSSEEVCVCSCGCSYVYKHVVMWKLYIAD